MFSDKIFIVHVYALEISCLCPYKESEISENDTSDFRLPQILYSAKYGKIFKIDLLYICPWVKFRNPYVIFSHEFSSP